MNDECFEFLLNLVKPYITKNNTVMRQAISAEERLLITLRFLATGRGMEDLKFACIISPQALGTIIPETCKYIYLALKKEYLKVRTNEFYIKINMYSSNLLKSVNVNIKIIIR